MPDRTIICKDCGKPFIFTERDQEFWSTRVDERTGKPWRDPVRCKACRDIRRQAAPKQDMQTG